MSDSVSVCPDLKHLTLSTAVLFTIHIPGVTDCSCSSLWINLSASSTMNVHVYFKVL